MTRIKCDKTIRVKALSANQRALRFPDSRGLLAELNLPDDVIATVIGKKVTVSVFPEEKAMTRKIDDPTHEDSPFLIDREGICWNGYRPVRVQFADGQGRVWRCPRYWLDGVPELSECAAVEADEEINLPTEWDLGDVNVSPVAQSGAGKLVPIEVRMKSGVIETSWCDSEGVQWRIPTDWRRRVVRLPDAPILAAEGLPRGMADRYAMQIVAVNYHPGSLCCMPEHYRWRDVYGSKWPVRISDCELVGFGTPR